MLAQGKDIITNAELVGVEGDPKKNGDPVKFTLALLALKHRTDKFITKSFNNDMDFQRANDQTF